MRELMRDIGVSDCEMSQGSLRCDANVNVHVERDGRTVATPIVEIKNLNSFQIPRAVDPLRGPTAVRTTRARPSHYTLDEAPKSTAGWDEVRGVTVFQRHKELAADYRYFPEPDLVPVVVDAAWLDRIRAETGELPATLRRRLAGALWPRTTTTSASLPQSGRATVALLRRGRPRPPAIPRSLATGWPTPSKRRSKSSTCSIEAFPLSGGAARRTDRPAEGVGPASRSWRCTRSCSPRAEPSRTPSRRAAWGPSSDDAVAEIVRRAMDANPKAVADYRKGKKAAANAIKGAILRETRGAVGVEVVQRVLEAELERTP